MATKAKSRKVTRKIKDWKPKEYRNGFEGFEKFCEELCSVPIYPPGSEIPVWTPIKDLPKEPHPETGRSYWEMWDSQKKELKEALRMEKGRFVYRLIILCWPRGEGKSLVACLIQLWKFFCWHRQQIMLGANSRDQVKFVHFDIMRDIIVNSPNLLFSMGQKNVQEKQFLLRDNYENVISLIRAISSFSGIVSNITGYTFSEIFDMKNPKFFVQLDGSTRTIPNALGVIDSTVSSKQHILYQLYDSVIQKKTSKVFFSYRYSQEGKSEDYWNPNMTQEELEDYRAKFPLGDFERYFLNLWSAGARKIFTEEMLEATEYLGTDGLILNQPDLMEVIRKKNKLIEFGVDVATRGLNSDDTLDIQIQECMNRLKPVEDIYSLREYSLPRMALIQDLEKLSQLFDTDWAILVGADRADPMKTATAARTIVSTIAKGLPGSRSHPFLYDQTGRPPLYLYLLLHVAIIDSHSLEDMKSVIMGAHIEYEGIDSLCGERWGMWDLAPWCEENEIQFFAISPNYDRQKTAFSELFVAVRDGRFKKPPLAVSGYKGDDIFVEEALAFDHDPDIRWFGSPEKGEKYGVQDDCMYSIGWSLFGGKEITPDQFRPRTGSVWFGTMVRNRDLTGIW